jgi:hypothetical protein
MDPSTSDRGGSPFLTGRHFVPMTLPKQTPNRPLQRTAWPPLNADVGRAHDRGQPLPPLQRADAASPLSLASSAINEGVATHTDRVTIHASEERDVPRRADGPDRHSARR